MKWSIRQQFWLKFLLYILLFLGVIAALNFVMPLFTARIITAFFSIFTPFMIAVFLRYLVAPLDQGLIKLQVHSILARSIILVTLLIGASVAVLLSLGTILVTQSRLFIESDWPNILIALENFAATNALFSALYQWAVDFFTLDAIINMPINVFGVFQSFTAFMLTVVLTPIYLFFMLKEGPKVWRGVMSVIPKKWHHDLDAIGHEADTVIQQYFKGRFTLIIILAVMSTIGFFVLGFQSRSLLFGIILGVLDIVPFVGPLIGLSLPLLYSLTDSSLLFGAYAPLAVLIVALSSQLIQTHIITPLIMSKETKIHPLVVLSALLFFGYLLGVVGIILAIPLVGTLIAIKKYYNKNE